MDQEFEGEGGEGCPPGLLKYFIHNAIKKSYKCRFCAVLSPDSSRKGKFKDNSSRSNFYRHLRDFHKDEMETAAQRNETFGELMATAFAVNLIPFNVIDSKEMRAALQYADLKIPSRRALSTKFIPRVLEKTLFNIIAKAKGSPVCITTDGWSNATGGVYLEAVLATKPLDGSHDAAAMAALIEKELSLSELEVHCAVTDGAAVMPACCRLLGIENMWCVVHVLQLAVRTLESEPSVKSLFDKMNRLASHLNRSGPNRAKLESYLEKNGFANPTGIPRSCPTRWNSNVFQLRKISEYVDTINEMIYDDIRLGITEFTPDEKKLNKALQVVLPFPFSATADMCASTSCISDALVLIMSEKDNSSTVRMLCTVFRNDLEHRMDKTVLRDDKFKLAAFIDPRYFRLDNVYSTDKKTNDDWWTKVETVFMATYEPSNDDDGSDAASLISQMSLDSRAESEAESQKTSALDRSTFTGSLMDDILPGNSSSPTRAPKSNQAFLDEVARYKEIVGKEPRETGPKGHLVFWKKHSSALPALSQIARKVLSIPASSVLSERTFSRATALYRNKNRHNMVDLKGEMCILVGANRGDDLRPRNVKKVRVKPIKSMGDYSSEDESHSDSSGLDEESEGEMEMMKESLGRFRKAAKDHQAEIEADRIDNVTTSRSKRGRDATKQSKTSVKRSRK